MAVSAESDRTTAKQTESNPDINLLSVQGKQADPFAPVKRMGADLASAAITLGISNFPSMVGDAMGVCMGPYAKIASKGLAIAAGLIGGGFANNVIAGRGAAEGEGFLRNAAVSGLGAISFMPTESKGFIAQGLLNTAKYGLAGAGYQGLNIVMGDKKPDGTPYSLQEGLLMSAYAGLNTGWPLGLSRTLSSRIIGEAGRGTQLAVNAWHGLWIPSVSYDFRNMYHKEYDSAKRAR